MKRQFLDLGRQPIANGFLSEREIQDEYFFHLKVGFDDETKLVSLMEFVKPERMFNDSYVYYSSMSKTMREHFKNAAASFVQQINPASVLEIGSNDGVFIRNFSRQTTTAVEPCGNFSELTNELGYYTYSGFWTIDLAEQILKDRGPQDLIFSANCMCHIEEILSAFAAVGLLLSEDGVFIFEDPSLLEMIHRTSYDQIYDEHAHIFSVLALKNLLALNNLEIFKVERLSVHGGSNRIYVKKTKCNKWKIDNSVEKFLKLEIQNGLAEYNTYLQFAKRVEKSKNDLLSVLYELKEHGERVVSYGATSKSTTIFNYCGIDTGLIEYIVDTTIDKQGKLSPGVHIPVISPDLGFDETTTCAFLGAWNYSEEIFAKESEFFSRGGKFITHVPHVRIVRGDDQ